MRGCQLSRFLSSGLATLYVLFWLARRFVVHFLFWVKRPEPYLATLVVVIAYGIELVRVMKTGNEYMQLMIVWMVVASQSGLDNTPGWIWSMRAADAAVRNQIVPEQFLIMLPAFVAFSLCIVAVIAFTEFLIDVVYFDLMGKKARLA